MTNAVAIARRSFADPSLSPVSVDGASAVAPQGDWVIQTARLAETVVAGPAGQAAGDLVLDLGGIGRLDTAGALVLNRLISAHAEAGRRVRVVNVSQPHRVLIEAVRDKAHPELPPAPALPLWRKLLTRLGERGVRTYGEIIAVLGVLGGATTAFALSLINPRKIRFIPFVHQLERTALNATPIIALMSFLIGGIIAQQGAFYFRRFGADLYVVDMVGVLVLREIGVLLTAIMVAGRSGSSFTAELGSMKMREEVDALRVIGLDPIEVLVVPRVVALMVALPILTFISNIASILGAALVCVLYAGIPFDIFMQRLGEAVQFKTFMVGMWKAPFMALIIGLVACVEGLQVKGSAESLGTQTTQSVVKAIFMVIVVDGIFAMFYAAIGV